MYFCSGACGWPEVKAYYAESSWGVDPRFSVEVVRKKHGERMCKNGKKRHLLLLNVTMSNVQFSDAGVYYCAWAIGGKEIRIEVLEIDEELEIMKRVLASTVCFQIQLKNCHRIHQ